MIKVTRVNEFEFLREEKTDEFKYSYPANVSVQYLNEIIKIRCSESYEGRNEISSLEKINLQQLKNDLAKLNIELNFDDILNEYDDLKANAKIENAEINKEIKEKAWDNSWVHSAIASIATIDSSISCSPSVSREGYSSAESHYTTVNLKMQKNGSKVTVTKHSTQRTWSMKNTPRQYSLDMEGVYDRSGTSHVDTIESVVKSFNKLIAKRTEKIEQETKYKQFKEEKNMTVSETLKSLFNLEVAVESEYQRGHNARSSYSYDVYKLIKGERKIKIGFNSTYVEFKVEGIENLDLDQAKAILNIL